MTEDQARALMNDSIELMVRATRAADTTLRSMSEDDVQVWKRRFGAVMGAVSLDLIHEIALLYPHLDPTPADFQRIASERVDRTAK